MLQPYGAFDPEKTEEAVDDTEIRLKHEQPHDPHDHGCDHQGQYEQNGDDPFYSEFPLKQKGRSEPENELHGRCKDRVQHAESEALTEGIVDESLYVVRQADEHLTGHPQVEVCQTLCKREDQRIDDQ